MAFYGEPSGTTRATLQDFLPRPYTVLSDSSAVEVCALIIGLFVVWSALVPKETDRRNVPKFAKYIGVFSTLLLLSLTQYVAIIHKRELAISIDQFIKSNYTLHYYLSPAWHDYVSFVNFFYYVAIAATLLLVWFKRYSLGAGVLRVLRILKVAHRKF